ncbi:iron-sulfur cluster repair di-iron protein, ric [Companilactobacillus jidongensis]|uniref:iron-sulfur cluster repair di-iron protein, ric n=1 Tax=Companilactobacillus jidongensis TaxID=2486006 RepID=UPI000F78C965|nr:iron-sulfur cluster repair di-iron protein, ric [Companilactobacillus jidongensis]
MTAIQDYLDERQEKLEFYTKAITNAHGKNHPEVFNVRDEYVKLQLALESQDNLDSNFAELRKTTNNYAIPNDVCPVFEATYHMLETADAIHTQV